MPNTTVGVTLPGEALACKVLEAWLAWWNAATPEQRQTMIGWYVTDVQRVRDFWEPFVKLLNGQNHD